MSDQQKQQRDSCQDLATLRDRVDHSLQKLGFSEARFVAADNETIALTCPVSDRNDQCVMSVAIRLLPGVSAVKFVSESEANQ